MKIAFITTQSLKGSTVIGRVLPLAEELAKRHHIHILLHRNPISSLQPTRQRRGSPPRAATYHLKPITHNLHFIGWDPFTRSTTGKIRKSGLQLIQIMLSNALQTAWQLFRLKPEVIVIVKSLPENVLAAWLYIRISSIFKSPHPRRILLDVDDFELTANFLSTGKERVAVHWAERTGARLAQTITAGSPFLVDHFEHLTQGKKRVVLIPTGINPSLITAKLSSQTSALQPTTYNLPTAPYRLAYVGSLSRSSGHRIDLLPEILLRLRRQLPSLRLDIFGDGDEAASLKNDFTKTGLDSAVNWHGRFNPETLPQALSAGTVLIDPIDDRMTNRAKSSYRTTLAAALGLPVITSNIGIRPFLLPAALHDRFFARPADVADYAAKILNIIQHPLTSSQQQELQAHIRPYTWPNLSRHFESLL